MSRVLLNSKNQITQKYNMVSHKGIDLIKYKNKSSSIIAHSSGVVVEIAKNQKNDRKATGTKSYGNYVKIKHKNGMYTLYAHLKTINVKKGQKVNRGDIIGTMGNSGNASGVHLHFEVRNKSDKRINPTPYIDGDLPNMSEEVNVIYQVYDNKKKKWLPNVINNNGYAGNFGNPISAIYINLTEGNVKYRVHEKNGKWLPSVNNRDDFAGNIGKNIDGIQIKGESITIKYRVHLVDLGWLSWVSKWDDSNNGYAGLFGRDIDAIQIKLN